MQIDVRPMQESDAGAVAHLSEQLGYPATPQEIEGNLALIREARFEEIFVADAPGKGVVGWVHVQRQLSVPNPPRAVMTGLVVHQASRGQGVGRLLVAQVEAWAQGHGLQLLRFTSQTHREDAHRFYERLGYQVQKTSHVFVKSLGDAQ